jgi:Zn-dependent protease with chaperone function
VTDGAFLLAGLVANERMVRPFPVIICHITIYLMLRRLSVGLLAAASFVALLAGLAQQVSAETIKQKRALAYKAAKEVMSPDLYLVYRVADRIITTNNIKRPIRVAVRNNVDCVGILGLDPNSAKCQSIQLLPQIDKATNFDIWAAQVVGTMSGSANAFAMSDAGTIFLNTAMLKELTGKIDQVACVVAHELAHVTQNHSQDKRKKHVELDAKTSLKVSKSVAKARNAQNTYIAGMAILGGINAGLGNSTYSTDMALNNLRLSAMLTKPRIAEKALNYSPRIAESFNEMQGLADSYVSIALDRIKYNLRDYNLEFAGFSRELEYEADLLGTEYVAAAGFQPRQCKKLWTETMNHDEGKLIRRLLPEGVNDPGLSSSKNGVFGGMSLEEIRLAAMNSTLANRYVEDKKEDKDDYKKVSEDVMQSLKSHPDGMSRAAAIDTHIRQKAKLANLVRKGKLNLNTIFVRNWSYDEQSESVVISDSFVDPKDAGTKETGITGIDVDKSLDF